MTEREPGFYWVSIHNASPAVAEWMLHESGGPRWCTTGYVITEPSDGAVEVLSARLVPPEVAP